MGFPFAYFDTRNATCTWLLYLTQDFPDDLLIPLVLPIAQHQYLQA